MTDATGKARTKLCWADIEVDDDDLPMVLQQLLQPSEAPAPHSRSGTSGGSGSSASGSLPSSIERLLRVGWLPCIDEGTEDSQVLSEISSGSTVAPDDSDEELCWRAVTAPGASRAHLKEAKGVSKVQDFARSPVGRAQYLVGH
eukprot:CAMPEP_0203865594 /NCGR_PEP_ID=MMETSP0359-20131031/15444_1 /ASSEMBLY_ACC=CAM_ASM_000338 /TAXON_ID=268821 /ORGANISM="Scrippsiella Hangoei, Strain SHTV-5" /LENGTH=143 /DNA_ID=CAMNT_0050783535 /DNA_START=41 /DNA_END=472 /DNA_ORIENTATION=-